MEKCKQIMDIIVEEVNILTNGDVQYLRRRHGAQVLIVIFGVSPHYAEEVINLSQGIWSSNMKITAYFQTCEELTME